MFIIKTHPHVHAAGWIAIAQEATVLFKVILNEMLKLTQLFFLLEQF